jgi:hypothetical protein
MPGVGLWNPPASATPISRAIAATPTYCHRPARYWNAYTNPAQVKNAYQGDLATSTAANPVNPAK